MVSSQREIALSDFISALMIVAAFPTAASRLSFIRSSLRRQNLSDGIAKLNPPSGGLRSPISGDPARAPTSDAGTLCLDGGITDRAGGGRLLRAALEVHKSLSCCGCAAEGLRVQTEAGDCALSCHVVPETSRRSAKSKSAAISLTGRR
jgi:hypothetical protein